MEDVKNIEDWCVVCRNTKCKHRYPIPPETPLNWKIRKFRGGLWSWGRHSLPGTY